MNKPALYSRANDMQRRHGREFAEEFGDKIAKMDGHCLDIGSGPGDMVVDFILPKLYKNASLICSDISEKMVNFGKDIYKDNQRVSFIILNIGSPDLPENLTEKFNHITSFYCLHWCRDMRQVFVNICNLLRPGGTSFLTFIATSPVFAAYEVLAAVPQYQPYMKDVARYIPVFQHVERPCKILEALLNVVGFEIHHCSVRAKNHTFKTLVALQDCLLAFDPFMDRMPTDLGNKYLKDLAEEVARRNIIINKTDNNDTECNIPFVNYLFVAYLTRPATECD